MKFERIIKNKMLESCLKFGSFFLQMVFVYHVLKNVISYD